jgi:hypothetical protein
MPRLPDGIVLSRPVRPQWGEMNAAGTIPAGS